MARRRLSTVSGVTDDTAAEPNDQVLVIDGVVEHDNLRGEQALAIPLVTDGAGSGIGISADELRRMVELDEERRAIIRSYIARNLKTGVDYGTIPVAGRESKPSLFKPGAEKICMLLQLRAEFEPDHATLAMAGNVVGLFAYICRLVDRYGRVVGEGRGASDLNEKRGWTVNNAIKIAEKRAQVDAVLRVVCLSEIFTQDLEDAEQRAAMEQQSRRQAPAASLPQRAGNAVPESSSAYAAPAAPSERSAVAEELCGDAQVRQIRSLLPAAGISEAELLASLNITSIRELSRNKAYRVIDRLAEKAQARGQ